MSGEVANYDRAITVASDLQGTSSFRFVPQS